MSASNGKWELGVVDFYDSFEDFDQFTKLNSDYNTPSSRASQTIDLDSSIAADYRAAPFYMHPKLNGTSDVPGSDFTVGPSTDTSYEGAIDKSWVHAFGGAGLNHRITMPSAAAHSHTAPIWSSFDAGDPVLIRTVPSGWTPAGTFSSLNYGVKPIARYEDQWTQLRVTEIEAQGGLDLDHKNNLRYLNQTGVRLVSDNTDNNTSRYIYRNTPVNSIDPRIRRWRMSWYVRVSRANPASAVILSNLQGYVKLSPRTADGTAISQISGELSGVSDGVMKNYTTISSRTSWTFDFATFSMYGATDSNTWSLINIDNPSNRAANRINRLQVQLGLYSGVNAALDFDDVVIEHAQGTTKEANGYYEIDDYPSGGVQWRPIDSGRSSFRTSNNALKATQSIRPDKQKFSISGRYDNVSTAIYHDILALLQWQDRGKLLSLRTYHELLPNVMVGRLTISEFNNELWDLGLVSFTLSFEEA